MDKASANQDPSGCTPIEELMGAERGEDLKSEKPERQAYTATNGRYRVVIAGAMGGIRFSSKGDECLGNIEFQSSDSIVNPDGP